MWQYNWEKWPWNAQDKLIRRKWQKWAQKSQIEWKGIDGEEATWRVYLGMKGTMEESRKELESGGHKEENDRSLNLDTGR